jgi:hypothetical protein
MKIKSLKNAYENYQNCYKTLHTFLSKADPNIDGGWWVIINHRENGILLSFWRYAS